MSYRQKGGTWAGPLVAPATARANAELIVETAICNEDDLMRLSPVPIDPEPYRTTIDFLSYLFHKKDPINIIYKHESKDGKLRPTGYGLTLYCEGVVEAIANKKTAPFCDGGTHIRLNPMDGKGITDKNVSDYRYALLEWDLIPIELQVSLVAKLALPIAAVVTSGNKSIHAWVLIDAPDFETYKSRTKEMFWLLGPTGVDPHNVNPSRLSRLPGTHRRVPNPNGIQKLLYLNPEPKPKSIL